MNAIGILGGSFDPIHRGHMQLARDALDQLALGELRLIPAARSWQKATPTPAADRARMVQLAIESEAPLMRRRLALDMREIERGGASYTIDTLRELRQLLPTSPLVLIMGGDQFGRLDTWRQWRALLSYAHIAVARRGAEALALGPELAAWHAAHRAAAPAELASKAAGLTLEFQMTPMELSSTEVRRRLADPAAGPDQLAPVIASAVLDYIRAHRLYLNE